MNIDRRNDERGLRRTASAAAGVLLALVGCGSSAEAGDGTTASTTQASVLAPGHMRFYLDRAIVGGSACQAVDPSALGIDGDSGIDLARGVIEDFELPLGTTDRTELTLCSLRVPIEVADGWYIDRVRVRAEYAVFKTHRATLSVRATATAFGHQPAAEGRASYGEGVVAELATVEGDAGLGPRTCGRSGRRGILAVDFGVAGLRPNRAEGGLLRLRAFPLRSGDEITLKPCP
jgi:hypothetical protein